MAVIPPMETVMCDSALKRYWEAKTSEEERSAYAELLAAGFAPSYGESVEEAAKFVKAYGLPIIIDPTRPEGAIEVRGAYGTVKITNIASVRRDIARGG